MKSARVLLIGCVCIGAYVLLDAAPVHAAVESAGLLDRATRHFQESLTKWGDATTTAATALFWMLATIAFCWELGSLALRGGSMEAAIAYVVRFAFILGLWLYILQHAVPIGLAIVNSLRKLGSAASGLPENLMPSRILDVGFSLLWKTIAFVLLNPDAPLVAGASLVMAVIILLAFALTALNMLVLIVSQWFLLYGGIFFLGFGVAPWGSEMARNYLYLVLSIGAQLFGMAGVVGIGQSFILEQYAQLSGKTAIGELAVILVVAVMIYLLANEIPKLFARFVPGGHAQQGVGLGTLIGATVSAAAAIGTSAAMVKGAAASMAGIAKATNAAYGAAKSQSQVPTVARSQTGVSAVNGSIGPSGGGGGSGGSNGMPSHGALGALLGSSGSPQSRGGTSANSNGLNSRGDTHTTTPAKGASGPSKPNANEGASPSAGAVSSDARPDAPQTSRNSETSTMASASSQSTPENPRSSTASLAQAQDHVDPMTAEQDAESSAAPDTRHASGSAERGSETSEEGEDAAASEAAQKADTGSVPEPATKESDDTRPSSARGATATLSEPATAGNGASSTGSSGTRESASTPASATSYSTGSSTGSSAKSAAPSSSAESASAPAAHAAAVAGPSSTENASTSSVPTGSPSNGGPAAEGGGPKKAATSVGDTGAGATARSSSTTAASKMGADSESSAGASTAVDGSAPSPSANAASPNEPAAMPGGQRAATAMGTILTTAKILGGQAVQRSVASFMERADRTAGGQIAQAIRDKYGLDVAPPSEIDSRPLRSHTGASHPAESHVAESKHPANWISGSEPMTDKQWDFLERKLGDDVDPNMTKAEAATLIDELLDDEG